MSYFRPALLGAVSLLTIFLPGVASAQAYPQSQIAPTSLASSDFITILKEAGSGTPYYSGFGVTSSGVSADVLKILQTNDSQHPYLGLFHHLASNGLFEAFLAYSTDLKSWSTLARIDTASGMPDAVILSDNSVLYAEERNPSGNRPFITVRYYASLAGFISNPASPTKTIDLPQTSGASADGTPQFGRITYGGDINQSSIQITYHYFAGSTHDQEAVGTLTNFSAWSGAPDSWLNSAMATLGYTDLGDREWFQVGSVPYELLEARPSQSSGWAAWRIFLIDRTFNKIQEIDPQIVGGAYSVGNPSGAFLTLPDGRQALEIGYFLFSEGTQNTPAGAHVYIYPLPTPISPTPAPTPTPTPAPSPTTVLSAPAGLSAKCASFGGSATLSWAPVSAATSYRLRIVLPTNTSSCAAYGWQLASDGKTCSPKSDSWTTNVKFPTTMGATYKWSVSAVNGSGVSSATQSGFTCRAVWTGWVLYFYILPASVLSAVQNLFTK